MFADAFTKLDPDETAEMLQHINPLLKGAEFQSGEATIMAIDLPFYHGYQFFDIMDKSTYPARHRYVVYGDPQDIHVIDFTNEPIYKLNASVPLMLDEHNIEDYVRFFFTYVRGQHGRFILIDNLDDIAWKEDPPPQARKAIAKMVLPLTLESVDKDESYHLSGSIIFKDSLFKSEIIVRRNGQASLLNEELLIEDMPILDDVFGH